MKPFLNTRKVSMALEIAPLIDVVFMLLLFFMLTSSFIKPSIPLKLPEASNKEKIEEQDIVISVRETGEVYFNRQVITLDGLKARLESELAKDNARRVIFQGDEGILYKKFVTVLDKIKAAGVKDINIAHEVKETE